MTHILFILLTVMSFTVESKNSVSADGQWPYDMEVVFSNTYSKGQVRNEDVATLTVSHLEGINIKKITVSVKTNKNSGAGTFEITANGNSIANVPLSYKQLAMIAEPGSFGDVDIFKGECAAVDELVITLTGTENSLHVERFSITYTYYEPHTVTLIQDNTLYETLTEENIGSGVYLPHLDDVKTWHFIGWTETNVYQTHEKPTIIPANQIFKPSEDCTLWALYQNFEKTEPTYMTEIQSGTYLYVNTELNTALYDVPDDGRMQGVNINSWNERQYYHIDFTSPDTAYITHAFSLTPIGYSGTQLTIKASPWLVYHDGEQTLFYAMINGKSYVLWLNIYDTKRLDTYAGLLQASPGASPMRLMEIPSLVTNPEYTCHPDSKQDLPFTLEDEQEVVVPIGIYELHVINGQKRLIIR